MVNLIAMARPVSDENKIQGNSLPEVRDAWKQASLDLGREPEIRTATGGALRDGNLLNAFLLYCLSRPDDERKRIAAWGLRALERLKEADQPVDLRKIPRDDFGRLGGSLDGEDEARRPRGARVRSPGKGRSKRTG